MNVIRNRRVEADRWRHELSPPHEQPTATLAPGDVIVCLERWLADREALLARGSRVGVQLAPGEGIDALIEADLHELWLVELRFDSFADGRAYSLARLLRSRHDFHGDLRAAGEVSRDRLAFMERCGFNVFALPEGADLEAALAAFDEVGECYQPAEDGNPTIAHLRGLRQRLAARRPSAAA